MRRIALAAVAFAIAAGFYLLLIDTTDLPELLALAVVAALATAGFETSRLQGVAEAGFKLSWLRQAWRPVVNVPRHAALVSYEAIRQLLRSQPRRGSFRAIPFQGGKDAEGQGRVALTESLGSFAPNTIVIGVDSDRHLLLVHQLHPQGGREELDVLRLG
ncbi:MAG: Na+/H+ antiporter subunit E [Solirubrobacterales bacterium]|nr:Na+/H+ antiporter subunit E [Solirubrobacterales bacterium]